MASRDVDHISRKPKEAALKPEPIVERDDTSVGGLKASVIQALRSVFDPEIPVNIYELGLIYTIDVKPENLVEIKMSLTSPACPVAGSLPGEIEERVKQIDEVNDCTVEVVWDPQWSPDLMSEAAKLELGFF